MTIQRKLQINILLLLIFASIISVVFVVRSNKVRQAENVLFGISSVGRETILLYSLTQNYVVDPTTENENAWLAEHAKIQQILNDPVFDSYETHEPHLILKMISNTALSLFTEISESKNNKDLRVRLESKILLHSKSFTQESARLEQAVFADAETIRQQSSVIFFVLLELLFAVATVILVLNARTVLRPIAKLTSAVRRIEGGDYSVRAPASSRDEVGELGAAFNGMAEKVLRRTMDLESINKKDQLLVETLNNRVRELEEARRAMANLLQDFEEERKLLEEANIKDEALLENIGDGVIAVDKDKKIILINRVAEYLLGIKRHDVLGKNYYDIFANETADGKKVEEPDRPITKVLVAGQKYVTPLSHAPFYYYIKKDGTKFPVSITVTPVIVNGETVGAIDIFRDITKEREIEKLRMDFLALASHQLRTPLSGTKWLIETMKRGITGAVSKKQKEYLDQIYQTNERMIALVYDMLDVLRLESGGSIVEKKKVSVADVFNKVVSSLEHVIQKQEVVVRNATKSNQELSIDTDPEMLGGILEELMSNAIEYSQKRESIVFEAREEDDSLLLSVSDHGIGIPKDERARISERFYRASNAKEFRPEGTGLGLYRANLLATKLNADITLESDVGKGTTFFVRIPKVAM